VKKSYNYLYVEDDALSREVMHELLIEVVGVASLVILENSQDFLARVKALEPPPDFILLDIYVEPHNGYALLDMIRRDADLPPVKVIAVTASVMSQEVDLLQARGFDGALAKPLDMETFPDLIRRLEAGETVWQIT
jgi:CheY-like chemotaxis protein